MLSTALKLLGKPGRLKNLSTLLGHNFTNARRDQLFASIAQEVESMVASNEAGVRVLYGPSFSIFEPCRVHDFILTQALRLRGAEIIPCAMGRLQFGETSYIGGYWGGAKDQPELSKEQDERNYKLVADADQLLWATWCGLNPVPLDRYVPAGRIAEIKCQALQYSLENYNTWTYHDLPVGQWALDTLRNNVLVSDERLVPHYKKKLRAYLHHVMVMVEACRGVLDEVKPDIVISNDSYYYPWAILEKLCGPRDIAHYNYWPGVRKNGVCYAKGEPAMNLNLTRAWQSFQKQTLSATQQTVLEDFLATRKTGNFLAGINTSDPSQNARQLERTDLSRLNPAKPTALLAANVCWDLCALDKNVQFRDMFDWIAQTVRFVSCHPEWQLIVKAHPGEENQSIPETRQKLKDELTRRSIIASENVLVLGPRTEVSVYDLFPYTQVGLVYTTTVGLEMACLGIPVITAGQSHYCGMGFTHDPRDVETYFAQLVKLLSAREPASQKEARSNLAKKFFYLYEFEYPIDLRVLEYGQGKANAKVESVKDLAPGRHAGLDFVCDRILDAKPFF